MQNKRDQGNSAGIPRPLFILMIMAAAVLLFSLGARSVASWNHYGDLDHNSPGTWLGMAQDASQGILYRPIVSDSGYGGSRYAPLYPVILAGFIRAGINPVISGFLVGIAATLLLVGGLFALMRKLGTPIAFAAALAIFALAAACVRTNILGIKADLLPLGLSLWGLVAVLHAGEDHKSWTARLALIAGAVCFALAISAKVTSVFGLGAATLWLLSQRRFRQAAILCAAWGITVFLAILMTQWASDGRALGIFRICAGAGGSFRRLFQGPMLLFTDVFPSDPVAAVFWAIALLVITFTNQWTSLPAIFLVVVTLGTMAIYGSPGTHLNHLLDVTAAAILVIGTLGLRNSRIASAAIAISVITAFAASAISWRQIREIRHDSERTQMELALMDADKSSIDGPILSEDPLLPMLRGQKVYMLDPFLFRAVRAQRPAIADQFWADLETRHFKAVILHAPPTDPDYSSDEGDFGPGFIDRLSNNYTLTWVRGKFFVFLPKTK